MHTWGENLTRHVYLHCLVPGGVLRDDGQWRAARGPPLNRSVRRHDERRGSPRIGGGIIFPVSEAHLAMSQSPYVNVHDRLERSLNSFATQSFRDQADRDYIAARLACRYELFPQFSCSSHQAIEKYLKAIFCCPTKRSSRALRAGR